MDSTFTGFAHYGKGFWQKIIEGFPIFIAFHHLRQKLIHRFGFHCDQLRSQALEDIAQQLFQALVCPLFLIWGGFARLVNLSQAFLKASICKSLSISSSAGSTFFSRFRVACWGFSASSGHCWVSSPRSIAAFTRRVSRTGLRLS